jgi:hypothetical protein
MGGLLPSDLSGKGEANGSGAFNDRPFGRNINGQSEHAYMWTCLERGATSTVVGNNYPGLNGVHFTSIK